ncbi:MAG: hypothetical protein LBS56_04865 [Propionibacteriaceae bacterium]|jgi:acid stress chaperone HdeA|nr:hypothetical protein [Propionibacteriaceae bacterium]
MPLRSTNRPVRLLALAAALALALSGALSGCSSFNNQGGNTTCADYLEMDPEDRKEAVVKMIEDNGDEATTVAITVASASALIYCQHLAEATATIVSMYDE